jgi:colanic acid/amylovoran biosynthesis glycosyltransferase
MRIAVVVNEFPSISETFIMDQVTGLMDLGHDVEIFAAKPGKGSKVHPDVRKYRLLSRCNYFRKPPEKNRIPAYVAVLSKVLLKKPVFLCKVIKAFKETSGAISPGEAYKISLFLEGRRSFDAIICHFGPNGNTGVLLKKMGFNGKVLTFFHGYDMSNYLRKWGRAAYNYLFREGDIFLPISAAWKEEMIKMGCPEEKILVHRMGVDVNKFGFDKSRANNGKNIKLLTVARLVEKKGVRYGIEAVARLLPKYSGLEYRIAGDGPLKKDLQGLIEDLGCTGSIKLLGWKDQDEIIELMNDTHIILAPSVTGADGAKEGIPVVLMEALAQGIPVLSTLHSGIPEIITDGKSGYLVPERDVDSLTLRLDNLLADPALRAEMGREGRRYVECHYDVKKLTRRLDRILTSVLSGRGMPVLNE